MKGIKPFGPALRSCGYWKVPSFFLAKAAEVRATGTSLLSLYSLSRMDLLGPGELSTLIFFCYFPASPSTFTATVPRIKWTQSHGPPLEKCHSTLGRQQNPSDLPVILYHCPLDDRLRDPWAESPVWVSCRTTAQITGLPMPRGCSSSVKPVSQDPSLAVPSSPPHGATATFSHCAPALNLRDLGFLLHSQVCSPILSPWCFPEVCCGSRLTHESDGFSSRAHSLVAGRPWASLLISPTLSFLLCKIKIIVCTS